MKKLDVVIGSSIIEKKYKSLEQVPWDKITQHRIILSQPIIDEYLRCLDDPKQRSNLKNFIGSVMYTEAKCKMCTGIESDDPRLDMIRQLVDVPFHTLIAESSEFVNYENQLRKSQIVITTLSDIESGSFNIPFNRFTVPFNTIARVGDECNLFIEWIKDLLESENYITIMDPYIMSNYNCSAFINDILPCIPKGADVVIYCAYNKTKSCDGYNYSDEAESLIERAADGVCYPVIKWCDDNDLHDRYIQVADIEIGIANSLSILKRNSVFQKECEFSIKKHNKHTLPKTKLEKLLSS